MENWCHPFSICGHNMYFHPGLLRKDHCAAEQAEIQHLSSNGSALSCQIPPSFPKILRQFKGLTQRVPSPHLELLRFLFSHYFLQVLTPHIFLS